MAVYEATLALARIRSISPLAALSIVDSFSSEAAITHVPIGEEEGRSAILAFERFGKGHHPAKLNMGDCSAYACARSNGARLLSKGADFPQIDIELA